MIPWYPGDLDFGYIFGFILELRSPFWNQILDLRNFSHGIRFWTYIIFNFDTLDTPVWKCWLTYRFWLMGIKIAGQHRYSNEIHIFHEIWSKLDHFFQNVNSKSYISWLYEHFCEVTLSAPLVLRPIFLPFPYYFKDIDR